MRIERGIDLLVGKVIGRDTVARLAGPRLKKIQGKLAQYGVITVTSVRLVPVAPFTIVNLVAGASRIGFREYVLGTIFGLAPGILAVTVFEQQLERVISEPSTGHFLLLGLIVVVGIFGFYMIKKWLWKEDQRDEPDSEKSLSP